MGKLDTAALKKKGLSLETLPNGLHSDGEGLYLQVSGPSRSWVYRYGWQGKTRDMGLGSAKALKLDVARRERNRWAEVRALGRNPIDERNQQRAAEVAPDALTFRKAAEQWVNDKRSGWAPGHAEQIEQTLKEYAYPTLGVLPLAEIKRVHVLDLLRPLWHTKPTVAKRLRHRVWSVFQYALACDEDLVLRNPAELDMIGEVLGDQNHEVTNHPSLPFAELPEFLADLRKRPGITARALELTILCALRTCECIHGEWKGEVDFAAKTWTIPASRMKAGKKHVVPLSARALEILRELRAERPDARYIFSAGGDEPLFRTALQGMLRVIGCTGVTVHGFRATFKTWGEDATSHESKVIEWALAHAVGNKVEQAYNRGALLDKRRVLMDDWAAFCGGGSRRRLSVVAAA